MRSAKLPFAWFFMLASGSGAVPGCGGRTGDLSPAFVQDGGSALGGSGVTGGGYGGAASGGHGPQAGGHGVTGGHAGYVGSGGHYVGAGGAPSCSDVGCPATLCAPGQQLTMLPGQCCAACTMSDPCAGVRCGAPACPLGTTFTTLPGECCPSCTPIADASIGTCDRAGYAQYLGKQITALDALSCRVESDCTIVSLSSACQFDCGTAVSAKSAVALYGAAEKLASTACIGCPWISGGNCPSAHSSCVDGACTLILSGPSQK